MGSLLKRPEDSESESGTPLQQLLNFRFSARPTDLRGIKSIITGDVICWDEHKAAIQEFIGHDLSKEEEQQELNAYLRTMFARVNIGNFTELARLCGQFFSKLTDLGRQKRLATQANLTPWQTFTDPNLVVDFKPPLLPEVTIQSMDAYVETLEVPNSFGSRLLWWLAAWNSPKAFGYTHNSLEALFVLPIWHQISPSPPEKISCLDWWDFNVVCQFDQRPLAHLRDAALNAVSPTIGSKSQCRRQRHGMLPDGDFCWEGEPVDLTPVETRLLSIALEVLESGTPLAKSEVEERIWGPNRGASNMSSAVSKLNTKLSNEKLPLQLTFNNKCLELGYYGSKPNPLLI